MEWEYGVNFNLELLHECTYMQEHEHLLAFSSISPQPSTLNYILTLCSCGSLKSIIIIMLIVCRRIWSVGSISV